MILCIETATDNSSVSIYSKSGVLGFTELHIQKSHSAYLNVIIEDLLKACDKERSDIKAVAVSIGPGSYTGLRIGLSTAKGICYALSIPLLAISSLEIMYEQVRSYFKNINLDNVLFCPMIDARRMEVYTAVYNINRKLILKPSAIVIEEGSFKDISENAMFYIFGNGALKCTEVLPKSKFCLIPEVYPSAKYMGSLAHEMYDEKKFADIAYTEPIYLKEYQAKLPKKNKLLS